MNIKEQLKLTSAGQVHYGRSMAPEGECSYCDKRRKEGATFFPSHDASRNCQSGGRNHCSCDTCF